jgi:hypothetical protein
MDLVYLCPFTIQTFFLADFEPDDHDSKINKFVFGSGFGEICHVQDMGKDVCNCN